MVFDTFDGRFVRLSDSTAALRHRLLDRIRPIYRPRFGGPDRLGWLRDRDLVVGYATRRCAYAFPVKVLNFRELVNVEIEGQPLLVSYFPRINAHGEGGKAPWGK